MAAAMMVSSSSASAASSLAIPKFARSYRPSSLQAGTRRTIRTAQAGGGLRVSCRKKGIHPEMHYDSKVFCDGELVMTVGGTMKRYEVDAWSGNHPFYLGARPSEEEELDMIAEFRRILPDVPDEWLQPPELLYGEIVLPPRRKSPKKKKK